MTLPPRAYQRIASYLQAREDKLPGGLGDKAETHDFSDKQIDKGLQVEKEHTDDPDKALEIVLDHLTENKNYYDYLEKAETKMKTDEKREALSNRAITRIDKGLHLMDKEAQADDEDLSYLETDIDYHVGKIVSLVLDNGEQALEDYLVDLAPGIEDQATKDYFKQEIHDRVYEMVLEDLEAYERESLYSAGSQLRTSAEYKGRGDPYTPEIVKRQDDWARMKGKETNLENWKHMGGDKVTDYKRGQRIDPVVQLFDYVYGTLDGLFETYQTAPDPADAHVCANVLERVLDVLEPVDQ